jgi:glycosyltransferase involved in cell wall biosynthesis
LKYLSVAVPCYNVEEFLDQCLSSFDDDRLREPLEVLIVDDGSTDSTPEIARRYVERYPDIFRLIQKENGGHGSAVNAGIQNATGKYFRIVDGDDWVDTDNLVRFIELLRETDTDLVVDQKTKVDISTGEPTFVKLPSKIIFNHRYDFLDVSDDEVCHFYALHTLSARLDILKENNIRLLERAFYVDNEYLLKVVAHSRDVIFYDLDIYRYRVGNVNQSVSHQSYAKRYDQHERVIRECLRFSKSRDWPEGLAAYMKRRILPLIRTHHIIALIYKEDDRREGRRKAREFYSFLKREYPEYAALTRGRYFISVALHYLGVNDQRLEKLKKLTGYGK